MGSLGVRFAETLQDLHRVQWLRHRTFIDRPGLAPRADGREADDHDALCDHVMVEDATGRLLCCLRLLHLADAAQIGRAYSARFYDLSRLEAAAMPVVELGRFCVDPGAAAGRDADVLRAAWGMVAAYVDRTGAGLLFGCSSFAGMDSAPYARAFDLLAQSHTAAAPWRIGPGCGQRYAYADHARPVTDRARALAQVPPLLRTYLAMGGWVSDHAVIDRDLNTLHVLTGLWVADIPAARARALRAVAGRVHV